MRKIFLILFTIWSTLVFGQKEVNGKITAGDSVVLTINYVKPSGFPNIEVLFKAEDNHGYPFWGLNKTDLRAYEDEKLCEITLLKHFSEQEPINIVLVLDHSGSMGKDVRSYLITHPELYNTNIFQDTSWLVNVPYPLQDAVESIKSFIPKFNGEKDKISLVTFSNEVDEIIPLGSSNEKVYSVLDTIKPFANTAFYDAVLKGIDQLKSEKGINVVIALTDGIDNVSYNSPEKIITKANDENVSLYCIGLGNVEKDTLQWIADSTNGFFIYTDNSKSLDSIYNLLERKIKAYYLLTYQSENWSSKDINREFKLYFNIDKIDLVGNIENLHIPKEVENYLKEVEQKQFFIYAGLGITFLIISIGFGIWYFKKKRKEKIVILKVYPNPGDGIFEIEVEFNEKHSYVNLIVSNQSGKIVNELKLFNGSNPIDISNFSNGLYILNAYHEKLVADSKKYLKK